MALTFSKFLYSISGMKFWTSFSLFVSYQKNFGRIVLRPHLSVFITLSPDCPLLGQAVWGDCQKGNCSQKPSTGSWLWDSQISKESLSLCHLLFFLKVPNYLNTKPSSQFSVTWYIYILKEMRKSERKKWLSWMVFTFKFSTSYLNPWLFTKPLLSQIWCLCLLILASSLPSINPSKRHTCFMVQMRGVMLISVIRCILHAD